MTYPLRLLPEAEGELAQAAEWYEFKRPGLGAEFMSVIDRAIARIADSPEAYPCWREHRAYRKCVVRRFPYLLFFMLEEDAIHVIAVAHARRRPGYWLGRARKGS